MGRNQPARQSRFGRREAHLLEHYKADARDFKSKTGRASRDDDAGWFALKFRSGRELAAKELDEAARAGPAIGAEQAHTEKKNQELENVRIFGGAERRLGRVLSGVGEKSGKRIIKFSGNAPRGRLLIDDPGDESSVSFGEGAKSGENIGIARGR